MSLQKEYTKFKSKLVSEADLSDDSDDDSSNREEYDFSDEEETTDSESGISDDEELINKIDEAFDEDPDDEDEEEDDEESELLSEDVYNDIMGIEPTKVQEDTNIKKKMKSVKPKKVVLPPLPVTSPDQITYKTKDLPELISKPLPESKPKRKRKTSSKPTTTENKIQNINPVEHEMITIPNIPIQDKTNETIPFIKPITQQIPVKKTVDQLNIQEILLKMPGISTEQLMYNSKPNLDAIIEKMDTESLKDFYLRRALTIKIEEKTQINNMACVVAGKALMNKMKLGIDYASDFENALQFIVNELAK